MAKETKGQQEVVERVMHEFKHGELKSGGGRKVRNPRQAVAIALHESGSSNEQTPAEDRRALKRTEQRERSGTSGGARAEGNPSRAELYEQAKQADIPGRSRMNKTELQRALQSKRH